MNKYSALICVFEKMNISRPRQEGYQKTDILSYRPFKLQKYHLHTLISYWKGYTIFAITIAFLHLE